MSKEATKKFVENNGFICNKCSKVIVDGTKHKNEEDLCDQCKISDLEAKLAESERKIEELKGERLKFYTDDFRRTQVINGVHFDIEQLLVFSEYVEHENWVKADKDKEIKQLKQQLAEKEKEIDEVRSNHANLVADIAYKAVNVYTAESKETGVPTFYKIHYSQLLEIEDMNNLRNYAQDKISFALEQLENVKIRIQEDFDYDDLMYWLNKQIKTLKEGK